MPSIKAGFADGGFAWRKGSVFPDYGIISVNGSSENISALPAGTATSLLMIMKVAADCRALS